MPLTPTLKTTSEYQDGLYPIIRAFYNILAGDINTDTTAITPPTGLAIGVKKFYCFNAAAVTVIVKENGAETRRYPLSASTGVSEIAPDKGTIFNLNTNESLQFNCSAACLFEVAYFITPGNRG